MSFGSHAFGRVLIVRAAGGMDVMVARIPAVLGRIDPAFERQRQLRRPVGVDGEFLGVRDVLGPAVVGDRVVALGQADALAIGAIDLRLEEKSGARRLEGLG